MNAERSIETTRPCVASAETDVVPVQILLKVHSGRRPLAHDEGRVREPAQSYRMPMDVDEIEVILEPERTEAEVWNSHGMHEAVQKHFLRDVARRAGGALMEASGVDIAHSRRGVVEESPDVDFLAAMASRPHEEYVLGHSLLRLRRRETAMY